MRIIVELNTKSAAVLPGKGEVAQGNCRPWTEPPNRGWRWVFRRATDAVSQLQREGDQVRGAIEGSLFAFGCAFVGAYVLSMTGLAGSAASGAISLAAVILGGVWAARASERDEWVHGLGAGMFYVMFSLPVSMIVAGQESISSSALVMVIISNAVFGAMGGWIGHLSKGTRKVIQMPRRDYGEVGYRAPKSEALLVRTAAPAPPKSEPPASLKSETYQSAQGRLAELARMAAKSSSGEGIVED